MGVNSLPKTVTRQRRGCDLIPGPSAPESSTLTTRLPSHRGAADITQLICWLIDWTLVDNVLKAERGGRTTWCVACEMIDSLLHVGLSSSALQ